MVGKASNKNVLTSLLTLQHDTLTFGPLEFAGLNSNTNRDATSPFAQAVTFRLKENFTMIEAVSRDERQIPFAIRQST